MEYDPDSKGYWSSWIGSPGGSLGEPQVCTAPTDFAVQLRELHTRNYYGHSNILVSLTMTFASGEARSVQSSHSQGRDTFVKVITMTRGWQTINVQINRYLQGFGRGTEVNFPAGCRTGDVIDAIRFMFRPCRAVSLLHPIQPSGSLAEKVRQLVLEGLADRLPQDAVLHILSFCYEEDWN